MDTRDIEQAPPSESVAERGPKASAPIETPIRSIRHVGREMEGTSDAALPGAMRPVSPWEQLRHVSRPTLLFGVATGLFSAALVLLTDSIAFLSLPISVLLLFLIYALAALVRARDNARRQELKRALNEEFPELFAQVERDRDRALAAERA